MPLTEEDFVAMDWKADLRDVISILERRIKELEDCSNSDDYPELRAMSSLDPLFHASIDFLLQILKESVPPEISLYMPGSAFEFASKIVEKAKQLLD